MRGGTLVSAVRAALLALALALPLPLLASGDAPGDHAVVATNNVWTPRNLTILPGDTVTFSSAQGTHSFVSDAGDNATCALPCTRAYPAPGRYDFHCGVHPTMRGTVSVGEAPAISVSSPAAGATLSGVVTVSGAATHPLEPVDTVQLVVDGRPVATVVPAADGSWSASWDTALAANGPRTLLVRALTAPSDVSGEVSRAVVVDNAPTVDLRAVGLSGSGGVAPNVTLTWTFENFGNVPSGPFAASFEYLYKGAWRPVGALSHGGLGPFSTETGRFVWDQGLHAGRYEVRVVLDPAGAVAETSEANNVAAGTASWLTPLVNGLDPLDP